MNDFGNLAYSMSDVVYLTSLLVDGLNSLSATVTEWINTFVTEYGQGRVKHLALYGKGRTKKKNLNRIYKALALQNKRERRQNENTI